MKKLLSFLLVVILTVGLMMPVIAQAAELGIAEKAATAKPAGLKATAVDGTSIKLTWNLSGVEGTTYEIQRKSGKKWKSLKVVDATEFTNTGLKKNTKYSYRVRAIQDGVKSGFVSASAKTKNPITSLKLNKKTATVRVGASLTLKATIKPKKATDKALTWKSSDTSIATVSTKGKVTPVADGKVTITVTSLNDKTASCVVTVKKRNPKSVSLGTTKVTLYVGDQLDMTMAATVKPSDADDTLKWSTSKKSVATVSSTGFITAKKAGTAKITVKTVNGKKKTCTVTVKKAAKAKPLGADDLKIYLDGELTAIPMTYQEAQRSLNIVNEDVDESDDGQLINCVAETRKNGYKFYVAYRAPLNKLERFGVFLEDYPGNKSAVRTYRGISLGDKLSKVETLYGKPYNKRQAAGEAFCAYRMNTDAGRYELCFDANSQTGIIDYIYLASY